MVITLIIYNNVGWELGVILSLFFYRVRDSNSTPCLRGKEPKIMSPSFFRIGSGSRFHWGPCGQVCIQSVDGFQGVHEPLSYNHPQITFIVLVGNAVFLGRAFLAFIRHW